MKPRARNVLFNRELHLGSPRGQAYAVAHPSNIYGLRSFAEETFKLP